MQVSATLIAAQQAAREARTRLAMPQGAPQAAPQPGFTAALEKTSGVQAGFSALPLKQVTAPSQQTPAPAPAAALGRMGQHVDITV